MNEDTYTEDAAAAALSPPVNPRTLRRWRQQGKVPYCRTPGGRIFYTTAQVIEISAAMRVPIVHLCAPDVPTFPDKSGEEAIAAE